MFFESVAFHDKHAANLESAKAKDHNQWYKEVQ